MLENGIIENKHGQFGIFLFYFHPYSSVSISPVQGKGARRSRSADLLLVREVVYLLYNMSVFISKYRVRDAVQNTSV
jgi:hypothetical protein